ncbi:helix-turn-helix transcriptional regulator [Slackia exigua]|nr:helix-turn-helix transcriptional regulator [Slackia exigua]STN99493.1 DNA-binding transcriptional regulator CsgD [Slackia exigua]
MTEQDMCASNGLQRSSLVTLCLAVLGFAVFLSAVWTARSDAAGIPDYTVHIARFVKVAGCLCIAWLFRSSVPSVKKLFFVSTACVAIHLVAYTLLALLDPSRGEVLPLNIFSGLFAGIGEAGITLLFAHLIASFDARLSSVALPVAYLLNEFFYATCLYLPPEAVLAARPACKALGIVLLAVCLKRKTHARSERENPMQYGLPHKSSEEQVLSFLSQGREWALLFVSATLFPFVFGLVAHICSSEGMKSGLYDSTNEIFALATLALLVIYGSLRGEKLSFTEMLCYSVPLFATGCALLPFLWLTDSPLSGSMVKCAYTIFQVMFWMILAQRAYDDPRHVYLYFGLYYGLFELATALARLIASGLNEWFYANAGLIWAIACVCLWLMALYGLFFFLIGSRMGMRTDVVRGMDASHKEGAALEGIDLEGGISNAALGEACERGASEAPADIERERERHAVVNFADRLEAFCKEYGLSAREQEVLVEAVHGYSMDGIGRKLFISRETVKTHLRHVYLKAGVANKQQLIEFIDRYAVR